MMGKSAEDLMALPYGGHSVAENIARAVAAGNLLEADDGTLSPPMARLVHNANWASVANGGALGCKFLMDVMFQAAYAKSAVPYGCAACFKVKAAFTTLRQLVAAWGLAKGHSLTSKWGIDFDNRHSQTIYAGYYYVSGLDEARRHYWALRQAYAHDPRLGPDITITIKRGCSEYEAAIGPSDEYTFTQDQIDLEAHLKTRFKPARPTGRPTAPPLPLAHWIDVAFRSGDETYRDFTGGQRLRPHTVTYDPGDPPALVAE